MRPQNNLLKIMEYNKKDLDKLYDILKVHSFYKDNELDAYIHALADIKESVENIYNKYMKRIIKSPDDKDKVQDCLWDIREEFRHIDYHLKDASLLE